MKSEKTEQGALPSLSNAEWNVMRAFWNHGPMAARDVVKALSEDHDWAYRTITTMLSRMVDKGALATDRVGNSFLYRPAFSRDKLTHKEVTGFVARVLDGSLTPLVTGFIEEATLSEKEIRHLSKLLDRKRKKYDAKQKEPKK